MRRKVVKVGASLCILLPKEVVRAMGWDFDDEINLILDEENEVVILRNLPPQSAPQKKTMMEHFERYQAAYEEELNRIEPQPEDVI